MIWSNPIFLTDVFQRDRGDHAVVFDRCTSVTLRSGAYVYSTRLVWQTITAFDSGTTACATSPVATFGQVHAPATIEANSPLTVNMIAGGRLEGNYTNYNQGRQSFTINGVTAQPYWVTVNAPLRFTNWNLVRAIALAPLPSRPSVLSSND
jgi:hypothetical protein